MRICHKNHVLRGNLLTFPLFCHKKRSQRGRNRLPPAFCHKFALFRGKLPHFSSFCHRKGLLRGNLPFRLCRRQGCVRDSRFRRAASVLDVPFAAELAILAATHLKSLRQSSQFASRTGASASAGYFALLKVSPVRIPVCYGVGCLRCVGGTKNTPCLGRHGVFAFEIFILSTLPLP